MSVSGATVGMAYPVPSHWFAVQHLGVISSRNCSHPPLALHRLWLLLVWILITKWFLCYILSLSVWGIDSLPSTDPSLRSPTLQDWL